jgi:hypothetical protein
MKAKLIVDNNEYPMLRITIREMNKLRENPKTKELCGFPICFDCQERIWPHVAADREDITVAFYG